MGKLTSVFAILAVALLAGAPPWAAAADDLNKEAAEVDQKIAKELADAERLKEMKKQQDAERDAKAKAEAAERDAKAVAEAEKRRQKAEEKAAKAKAEAKAQEEKDRVELAKRAAKAKEENEKRTAEAKAKAEKNHAEAVVLAEKRKQEAEEKAAKERLASKMRDAEAVRHNAEQDVDQGNPIVRFFTHTVGAPMRKGLHGAGDTMEQGLTGN